MHAGAISISDNFGIYRDMYRYVWICLELSGFVWNCLDWGDGSGSSVASVASVASVPDPTPTI